MLSLSYKAKLRALSFSLYLKGHGNFRATEDENAFMSSDLPERRIPVITLMSRVPSSAQSHFMYASRSTHAIIRSFSVSKLE